MEMKDAPEAWTREHFDWWFEDTKRQAAEALLDPEDGEVMPVARVLGCRHPQTGEVKPVFFYFEVVTQPELKHASYEALRGFCRMADACGIVQVYELWVRPWTEANTAAIRRRHPEIAPGEDALRAWADEHWDEWRAAVEPEEGVIVTGEYGRETRCELMRFTRDASGRPVLGAWDPQPGVDGATFARMLPGARGS